MFSIVICTMGYVHFLKQIFSVVLCHKDVEQVILIDNSYDNNTLSYLSGIMSDKLVIVRNKINQGVIRSRNQGLSLARGEYTMILDDDQIPQSSTFDQYKLLIAKFGILGCEAQIMDLKTGLTQLGNKDNFSYVGAGGMCMKTSLWRELGLFDEIYQPAYFEDPDICLKAERLGYEIGLVEAHGIHHYEHMTMFNKNLGFDHDKICIRNRKIFLARYGLKLKNGKKLIKCPVYKKENKRIKILHVLSNISVGGVQQNAIYLAKGIGKGFDSAIYIAESKKRGVFEGYVGDNVKLFYNKKISQDKNVKVYRNVSHHLQSVTDNRGEAIIVKPGGLLPDLGYGLSRIGGFRLDNSFFSEVDVTIIDVVKKYEPDILHYHRDVSRISRDITRLRTMPQFKDLRVLRTVHGRVIPNLSNYDVAVLLTDSAMRGSVKCYPNIHTEFIPNGIDINIFKPINVKKEDICITHTRLSKILKLTARPEIYFDIVKRVCEINKTIKFVLIGPDYELYKGRFDRYIRQFNLKDKLIIHPPLYYEDLVAYINKAKVWLNVTSEDNFPLSIIEAMLCKLPIVSSNLIGISEMIIHNREGLLCDPTSVGTFVKNILRCFSDESLSKRLSEAAHDKAVKIYSLESMLDKYRKVYSDLMGVK